MHDCSQLDEVVFDGWCHDCQLRIEDCECLRLAVEED